MKCNAAPVFGWNKLLKRKKEPILFHRTLDIKPRAKPYSSVFYTLTLFLASGSCCLKFLRLSGFHRYRDNSNS